MEDRRASVGSQRGVGGEEGTAGVGMSVSPATADYALPAPQRILLRLFRVWCIGVVAFGYGLPVIYGLLAWRLNEEQWRWTYRMYFTELPLVAGCGVMVLPWLWYRPIHRTLKAWWSGAPAIRSQCVMVYERALRLPWQVAVAAFAAALLGYLIGMGVVHWKADQPLIEIAKTLPAIPLVGGMMGAFCYFGTARALQPVVNRCSVQLQDARPIRGASLGAKFLTTTCILSIAALCLLQPTAYTLGQMIIERYMSDRALTQLRVATYQAASVKQPEDRTRFLLEAKLGSSGYVFAMDGSGRILTPHPRGYTTLGQERFYSPDQQLQGDGHSWVDRVGEHRVVAFVRFDDPPWTFVSISFLTDFDLPLRRFVHFSWLVALGVLFMVILFGRYYTRSITTPLAELTGAVRQIAEHGNLSQYVPITTHDEVSEVAHAFNQMVERLRVSKADVEDYTRRLERSTQELSALNQEMEDLIRVVSHDLRAPLINIQGFSKRLEPVMQETVQALDELAAGSQGNGARSHVESLKGAVQGRFAESLRFISKSVEKMDALLSSLLAVSRVGRKANPLQPNDLNEILDDVLATFAHQLTERTIQVTRHPLPRRVLCRRNEINQVFSNLISNAINYMGPTGHRCIEIGGMEDGERVECFVRDTGLGIDPKDHERIFQMFTRLQAVDVPGEGVGLAYVKKILRAHGGAIRVQSQRGQGSTFFFTLPALAATATRG
ncbi:MAG: HAMP domain-containing protein [Candidatus Omnitrophica bacterium]|nr:HAMP domain-containing protein [Candidatus Omnitrophota bacterium]